MYDNPTTVTFAIKCQFNNVISFKKASIERIFGVTVSTVSTVPKCSTIQV